MKYEEQLFLFVRNKDIKLAFQDLESNTRKANNKSEKKLNIYAVLSTASFSSKPEHDM